MNRLILRRQQRRTMRPPVSHLPSEETLQEQQEAAMQRLQTSAILPEQSLSLVQIFLNAAIATLLYTRQIIKHSSGVFSQRCVGDLLGVSGPLMYKDFLDLNLQAEDIRSQAFKILIKGRSERADKILTLLEGGIFDALQNGYLEAIQLSICADSSRPSEILECYTFTITYSSSSGQTGRNVSSVTVSPGPQTAFFVGDAQKSFNAAIKCLLKLIRGLPQLPRRRNLGLNLFYTDDCPASFEPRGFTGCVDDDLCFPGDQGLSRRSKKSASLTAGAHRVGVIISHVDSTEDEEPLTVIPENINYSLKRSRLSEYKLPTQGPAVSSATSSSQPSHAISQPLPAATIMASPAAPSSQTRADIATREALQQMQRSSSRPKELIPTQVLVNADDMDAEDSHIPDQSYSNALHHFRHAGSRPERMIIRTKIVELIIHARALQERCPVGGRAFDQDALDNFEIKRKEQPETIKCECIDNVNQGIMLLCEVCGTWQHQSCYGWDEVEEQYRPSEHFCYSCLLLPEEKDLNDWMPNLVACRNTLRYLYANGLPLENDLSGLMEAMHFYGAQRNVYNSKVMQILEQQGFINLNNGGEIIESKRQQGIVEYVDPLASIFHLYQTRDDDQTPLPVMTKEALKSIELSFADFALDAIRTHDSCGEQVIRYGYYPNLAARQSRKRSASAVEYSQDAVAGDAAAASGVGGQGSSSKVPRLRKMSRSEVVCFDETSSETQPETALDSDEEEEEEDLYN